MSLHSDNSYLFVNGEEFYKSKASNKKNNFPSQFGLGGISDKFDFSGAKEGLLKGNDFDF